MLAMDSSSSEEELELMGLPVALVAKKNEKRKHRVWVKEINQSRKIEGIQNLVNVMWVSIRECYFQ